MTALLQTAWKLLSAIGLAATLAGCSGVGMLNALTTSRTYQLDAGIAYGSLPRQKLDVYTPAIPAPAGGWPVVVFFYGGTWNTGERADFKFVGEAMAARGVLTLIADYRLYPEVRYPDFLVDSALAVAYGLENAKRLGGNRQRLFVMGHSSGGYNAAMVALDARWLRATGHDLPELAGWIGLAGPYDFYPMENPEAMPVFFHPNYPPNSQPIGLAQSGALRSFLGAPIHDRLVDPERNTRQMAEKLQAAGAPVTVKFYERASHTTLIGAFARPLRWLAPVLEDVATFVQASPPAK